MNKDVIHIDGDIAFVDEFTEQVIHHGLEGGRGIGKSKEHHHQFEEAMIGLECGLPLVTVAHLDVVVPPTDIQLCEERRPAAVHSRKSIHKLPDERKQGGVLDSEGIQSVVISDGSKVSILLLDEEEGECVGRLGLADVPLFKVLCNELLQGNIFSQGQRVHLAVHRIWGVWFQINGVVPFM